MEPAEFRHNLLQRISFLVPAGAPGESWQQFVRRYGGHRAEQFEPRPAGPPAEVFARCVGRLMTAEQDGLVLLSAAGAGVLVERAAGEPHTQRILDAIADCRMLLATLPACAVLRRHGMQPEQIPAAGEDWRDLLDVLVRRPDLDGASLILESTCHNLPLRTGLESRGTGVWLLPLVAEPLSMHQPQRRPDERIPSRSTALQVSGGQGGIAAMANSADDVCGLLHWLREHPGQAGAVHLFSAAGDVVEAGELLGLRSHLIEARTVPARWGADEARQIAQRCW